MASWLFGGKKKHKESPPDSPVEEAPQPDDEYIFVEKRNQPGPNGLPSNLYPPLNITPYPAIPTATVSKQNSQEGQTNDLNSIPFKLSKELERSMNEDLVIDKLRLDEIVSFIKRVSLKDYNYEFSLERSVIAEMESQNDNDE